MSKRAVAPAVSGKIHDDPHWVALTDAFHSAALGVQGWDAALSGLADATGSRCGELIGLGSNAAVPFNLVTNIDPGFQEDFVAAGGGDPAFNPRVRAGASAPPLKVLAEADYLSQDEYRRDPFVQRFASDWDVAWSCLTTLERNENLLVGLAVLRTRDEGHITSTQREAFASIAPHARAAIRTHLNLQGQGAALVSGAMEALSMAAFVCDRFGRVRALTPAAEQLIVGRRGLQLSSGRLRAVQAEESLHLDRAIGAASRRRTKPGAPILSTVILRGSQQDELPVVLDVIALAPRHCEFGFSPSVLVIARGQAESDVRWAAVVQAAWELTGAEADIALQLSGGRNADAIAARRGVSVGTVRTQIKGLLAKLGVKSQIELVARINQLR
jgi:DNA-binding CsgD family transcriptional regulator